MKKSPIWLIPANKLQKVLDTSSSYKEVLRTLRLPDSTGGGYRTLQKRITKENLCVRKLSQNRTKHMQKTKKRLTDSECFRENSNYNRSNLKQRLIKQNLIPYKCSLCSNDGFHNGHPLSLQLDHINGINNDHRLKNLRFLCPNCHSQTENYSGKRNKKHYPQKTCQCGVSIQPKSQRCKTCHAARMNLLPRTEKINWPTPEQMFKLIWSEPMQKLAKEMGVSANAIKKFCIRNNINRPKKGYWQKLRAGIEPT